MKKFAFTMIELIFVIVVVGIISAMVIPRMDRDNIAEAANQLVTHIKYTQHLAMNEDMYSDTDPNWPTHRWQIQLYACGGYAIHSNRNGVLGAAPGAPARADSAIDPQTRKNLFTTGTCTENALDYEKVVLSEHYGITNITTAGCAVGGGAGGLNIGFDNMGRPYENLAVNNGLLKQNCDINMTTNTNEGAIVRIVPETGYAYILSYY